MSAARGKLIVFEGIDGCGKSTQSARLVRHLSEKGQRAQLTFEPTYGPIGAPLRHYLAGRLALDARSLPYVYAADRADHLYGRGGMLEQLEAGWTVVCDRYVFSSLAYQVPEAPEALVLGLNAHFPAPDATVLLDLDPAAALERKRKQTAQVDVNDTLEKQRQVAQNFERAVATLGERYRVLRFDATLPQDALFQRILEGLVKLGVVSG